jgi:hypothetical protein
MDGDDERAAIMRPQRHGGKRPVRHFALALCRNCERLWRQCNAWRNCAVELIPTA